MFIMWSFKNKLCRSSLYKLNNSDATRNITPKFEVNWQSEVGKCRRDQDDIKGKKRKGKGSDLCHPSLTNALFQTFGKTMLVAAFYKFFNDTLHFFIPVLMSSLIEFIDDVSMCELNGYFYACSMYLVVVVQAIIFSRYQHHCMMVAMNIKTALTSMVYKKSLLMSNSSRKKFSVGEITNLISIDAQRIHDLMYSIHMVWSGPYVITVSLYLLWQQLGISSMAGFVFLLLLTPINGKLQKYGGKIQEETMKLKDERMKLMNEILNGIKVLKLYAWETVFEERVQEIRNKELNLIRKRACYGAVVYFLYHCGPFLVTLVSFAFYVLSDDNNVLDSKTAFVSISIFNIMRYPIGAFSDVISSITEVNVPIQRLTNFLITEEIDSKAVESDIESEYAIEVKDGSFSWENKSNWSLTKVNFKVKPGSIVAVVGHVGCGKSSLISALLGDMEKKTGHVKINGTLAYVPQQSWIQNGTLRENILFGKELVEEDFEEIGQEEIEWKDFDDVIYESRYQSIVQATALYHDFNILTSGDQTPIGDKGINLSGGQKQRVSLARAVCNDADIYLLDDPLSAVDSHIGKHIYSHVIGKNGLLKDKTRILVTHNINYFTLVDSIIVLDHGEISEVGTFQQLLRTGRNFSKFLKEYGNLEDYVIADKTPESITGKICQTILEDSENRINNLFDNNNGIRKRGEMKSRTIEREGDTGKTKCERKPTKQKFKPAEDLTFTPVSPSNVTAKSDAFFEYVKTIGTRYCVFIFMISILYEVFYFARSSWLSRWVAENDLPARDNSRNVYTWLSGYGGFVLAQVFFILLNGISQAYAFAAASKMLHERMLNKLMRATMVFFDRTPLGKIFNRFAKDIYIIDTVLPRTMQMALSCTFSVIATIVVMVTSTPSFLIVIIPVGIVYFLAQRFFASTLGKLHKLESSTRSPIYSHFGETVSGVSTIRAFGQNQRFIAQMEEKVDKNNQYIHAINMLRKWVTVCLEAVGNIIVLFAAITAVLGRGTISASFSGLLLSYTLAVTRKLNWWVKQMSEVETKISSVARVQEYTKIEQEAEWTSGENILHKRLSSGGVIEFENFSAKYHKDLSPVLRNISCKFGSNQKIGIVGRTGAGKSSFVLALFRLIEASEGSIKINGIDISKLGLHELRSSLTIIPQDPVLFSGTIRFNVDPFNKHTDEEVWDCLNHAHIREYVTKLPGKLDYMCGEGGDNMSVGQRQLVCLARALLRKSKILILDEATAAVDMQTDDLIQQTIRREFDDCTVITIAHRLNTIMDYDKIFVLDAGIIAEYGSPSTLLKQKGFFYKLVKESRTL